MQRPWDIPLEKVIHEVVEELVADIDSDEQHYPNALSLEPLKDDLRLTLEGAIADWQQPHLVEAGLRREAAGKAALHRAVESHRASLD